MFVYLSKKTHILSCCCDTFRIEWQWYCDHDITFWTNSVLNPHAGPKKLQRTDNVRHLVSVNKVGAKNGKGSSPHTRKACVGRLTKVLC